MLLETIRNGTARSPRLIGERIYLRPPRLSDWRAWAALREESRDFLKPWEPTWPRDSLSRAAYRRRLRQYAAEWREGTGYSFFVFLAASDQVIGGVSLANLRQGVSQSASLGYWMGKTHANQGYMSEALPKVLDYAFDRLKLHRVEAACLPENGPSRSLLSKTGFVEEGVARQYLRIDDAWRDHLLFAMLAEEWRAQSALRPRKNGAHSLEI
ncbi:MAG: GNAT family protein [Rhodovibrionaceae bacterium]